MVNFCFYYYVYNTILNVTLYNLAFKYYMPGQQRSKKKFKQCLSMASTDNIETRKAITDNLWT